MANLGEKHNSKRGNSEKPLSKVKNYYEMGNGKVSLEMTSPTATSEWTSGWYVNPSSGRSNNFGINCEDPNLHETKVIKGGCFFMNEELAGFLLEQEITIPELYGGLSYAQAQKEYNIASLIQKKFRKAFRRDANSPIPLSVKEISGIHISEGKSVAIRDYFLNLIKDNDNPNAASFYMANMVSVLKGMNVDILFPLKDEAPKSIKDDPYKWMVDKLIQKYSQGIYEYVVHGPNTRLIDLMTLELEKRREVFMYANNSKDLNEAIEKFATKLAEFYGLLHISKISYHGKSTEQCPLADHTIAGVVMDIGGMSEGKDASYDGDQFISQVIRSLDLIKYLCKNILKVDYVSAIEVFKDRYLEIAPKESLVNSFLKMNSDKAVLLRTKYLDRSKANWIALADDLKYLESDGRQG